MVHASRNPHLVQQKLRPVDVGFGRALGEASAVDPHQDRHYGAGPLADADVRGVHVKAEAVLAANDATVQVLNARLGHPVERGRSVEDERDGILVEWVVQFNDLYILWDFNNLNYFLEAFFRVVTQFWKSGNQANMLTKIGS